MKNKKKILIINLILLLSIVSTASVQCKIISSESITDTNIPDLELIRFESWWSNLSDGTLYVRYLTINKGSTYQDNSDKLTLNISIFTNDSSNPIAFINQNPFFDAYKWYHNETLGGCVQIDCKKKPNNITAHINSELQIPENNIENNINKTETYYGILIKGKVNQIDNASNNDYPIIIIKECNESTLQSSLFIQYNSTKNGYYQVCLYPKKPFNFSHKYTLIYSNVLTSISILKETKPISYNESDIININFPIESYPKPMKPITLPLGIQYKNKIIGTTIIGYDNVSFDYKFKWDVDNYSNWIKPAFFDTYLLINHYWKTSGFHQVKVIAKDQNGILSPWSDTKTIYILPNNN